MTVKNMVGWFEVYVDDLEKAKHFYEEVFQTKLAQVSPLGADESGLEMWMFPQNFESYGAGGAICKMKGVNPGGMGTTVYFSCDDCALEESRIVDSGGKVIKTKFSIGDYGYIAMCMDPAGNMIGLHSMK